MIENLVNGAAQPLTSLLALIVWSYVLAVARPGVRPYVFIVWAIVLAYALQSLTYLDVLAGQTAKTIAFVTRIGMVITAVGVVVYWHRRDQARG